jgi:serine phosphatase RsbU (regulator of sigma subunit)/Tfp pilus assembly protein PilF
VKSLQVLFSSLLLFASIIELPAQIFADRNYYLVDSLDLSVISEFDKELLDSSLKKYHSAKHDTDKLNALNYIVEESWDDEIWPKYNYWIYEFVKEKLKAYQAEKASANNLVQNFLSNSLASALNNIGFFHQKRGNISLGLEYYNYGLEIYETLNDKKGIAKAYNNIGNVFHNQGDIPLALEYYHKSLKIKQEINDKKGIAYTYNNIGYIYRSNGEIALALNYYQKGLKIQEEIGDRKGIAQCYNNIGIIHRAHGNTELTLEYLLKSLKIREEIQDKSGMANSYSNIGHIHNDQGNYALALEFFNKSIRIQEEIQDKHGMSQSYSSIGNLQLDKGFYAAAKEMGEAGLKIAFELGFPDEIERNASLLSKVAQKQGNWREAFEMRDLAIRMRDSINNEESKKATAHQHIKYEYEKAQALKEKEHEKLMAIAAEKEEKQKIISSASVGAFILVLGFLIFVFNRLKVTRQQKQIIETTHQKLTEHHKEIQDSIRYAKRIQEAILPSLNSIQKELKDGFVVYKPKDVVAGDFYWLEHTQGEIVHFAAADCTGHGVPGAMVSVVCSNALSKSLLEERAATTGELLDKTRDIVIKRFAKSGEEVKDGMDISICAIDFTNMRMQWSGANNPLWLIRDGEITEYKPDKQPIGMHSNIHPFTTHKIELKKNDCLYLFTDGFQDQFGGLKGKKYKTSQLKERLLNIHQHPMDEQKNILEKEFENWKGQNEQIDDVCIIGVRI